MVLLQPGPVLMSVTRVVTNGHVDMSSLWCNLGHVDVRVTRFLWRPWGIRGMCCDQREYWCPCWGPYWCLWPMPWRPGWCLWPVMWPRAMVVCLVHTTVESWVDVLVCAAMKDHAEVCSMCWYWRPCETPWSVIPMTVKGKEDTFAWCWWLQTHSRESHRRLLW